MQSTHRLIYETLIGIGVFALLNQTLYTNYNIPSVSLGLMFGAVVSTGAIITAPVVAVIIMAGACIVNVPYSAYKEFRIVKLPGEYMLRITGSSNINQYSFLTLLYCNLIGQP